VIPDEAVEAAARVMHAQDDALNDVGEFDLEVYRHDVTAILEAAAPHLMAAAKVATEEELDALPAWSVVLSDAYTHHESKQRISFQRWDDGAWHRGGRSASTHPDNFLPVTVLYVPGSPDA